MHTVTPKYQPPTATPFGAALTSAEQNAKFTGVNQINDTLDKFGNNGQLNISANTTLTQNQDVNVFANASSGAFTITLPALTGQIKSIFIYKSGGSYNKVTIQRAGSDTIDDPFTPVTAPIATSFDLTIPGDSVTLTSDGTYWRITNFNSSNKVGFYSTTNTAQTILGASNTKIDYEDVLYDFGGYYDNVTNFRYTPLVAGKYYIGIAIRTNDPDSPSAMNANIFKNGSSLFTNTFSPINSGNAGGLLSMFAYSIVDMNGTTDYIEPFYRTVGADVAIDNNPQTNQFFAYLVHRLG